MPESQPAAPITQQMKAAEAKLSDSVKDCLPKVYIVIGPPGCGKTTYLSGITRDAAKLYGGSKVLIASLTKTAAAEIASRFHGPERTVGLSPIPKSQVGTLHSHAFHALGHPTIVEDKHLPDFNEFMTRVVERLKLNKAPNHFTLSSLGHSSKDVDEPKDLASRSKGNRLLQQLSLFRSRMIAEEFWPDDNVKIFARSWKEWKAKNELMDFDDLIEHATNDTLWGPGKPHAIYLDESQDLSTQVFALVMKWAQDAGSIVCVADPDQSLYRWRGADPEALLWLASEHPSRKDQPREKYRRILSQSYRVPRAVHQYAVRWINQISGREPVEYYPTKTEGKVLFRPGFKLSDPHLITEASTLADRGKSVMFLASCDYMLIPVLIALKDRGIPFHNPYRTKRGDWNPLRAGSRLLNYLRPDEDTWEDDARVWNWEEFWSWIELIDGEYLCRGAKTSIKQFAKDESLRTKPISNTLEGALEIINNTFEQQDLFKYKDMVLFRRILRKTKKEKEKAPEIGGKEQKRLEYIFRLIEKYGGKKLRHDPRIVVGTVHSVKGGEADIVIASPELSPEGFASYNSGRGSGAVDVQRLFYVAFTRARECLILVSGKPQLSVSFPPPGIAGTKNIG